VKREQRPLLITIGLAVAIVVIVILLVVLKNKPLDFIYQTF